MLDVETMRVFARIRPPVPNSLEEQKTLDPAVSVGVQTPSAITCTHRTERTL